MKTNKLVLMVRLVEIGVMIDSRQREPPKCLTSFDKNLMCTVVYFVAAALVFSFFPLLSLKETLNFIGVSRHNDLILAKIYNLVSESVLQFDLQLWTFAYVQLLNKPYQNEVTLRRQKPLLKCC